MKRLYISLVSGLLAAAAVSAQHVSTTPVQANVLIEEFTGIRCTNCPDAHELSQTLMRDHAGRVFISNIHCGPFAAPGANMPDYRTEDGNEMCDFYKVSGFPSGLVNRKKFDGYGPVLDRSMWESAVLQSLQDLAAVNLWCEATYTHGTRSLEIDVEAYFVNSVSGAKLTVALLQNDIVGPQTGAATPSAYEHQHMLRDIVTATKGDPIANSTAGETFSQKLTYEVPENIEGVYVEPAGMELLVFVTDDSGAILNVINAIPGLDGYEEPNNVTIRESRIPINKYWGYDFLEAVLVNKTRRTVTDADFEVTVGTSTRTVKWEGEVAPRSQADIRVNIPSDIMLSGSYSRQTCRLVLMKANGEKVSADSRIATTISNFGVYPPKLSVTIKTDANPEENVWAIYDRSGRLVREFGPFSGNQVVETTEEVTLFNGTYCFEVTDQAGNGVQLPRGQFVLRDSDGNVVGQERNITGYGVRHFFAVEDGEDPVGGVEYINPESLCIFTDANYVYASDDSAAIEVYDLYGTKVAEGEGNASLDNLPGGLYIVKATAFGSTSTVKIVH